MHSLVSFWKKALSALSTRPVHSPKPLQVLLWKELLTRVIKYRFIYICIYLYFYFYLLININISLMLSSEMKGLQKTNVITVIDSTANVVGLFDC